MMESRVDRRSFGIEICATGVYNYVSKSYVTCLYKMRSLSFARGEVGPKLNDFAE
jgi:hypothetical protein